MADLVAFFFFLIKREGEKFEGVGFFFFFNAEQLARCVGDCSLDKAV